MSLDTGGLELFFEVGIGLGLLVVAGVGVIGARRRERIEEMRDMWGGDSAEANL